MKETVLGQFNAVAWVLSVNLDGVDHEASLLAPSPAGNCLNWIVGHLVASYDNLLPALGEEPVLTLEQKALYDRGAPPITAESAVSFDQLRTAFATAHERVVAGLRALPEERLPEPAPFSPGNNPEETIGSLLAVFAFHQAYHAGQTGLGRRLAGLAGGVT